MSAAAAATDATDVPKKKGSKKLIMIIGVVVLLLAIGGGGAVYMMKKRAAEAAAAAEAEDSEEAAPKAAAHGKKDGHVAPTFLPLEPFVVNLADRDQDRFAQIGITLQVDDPHVGDELKAYMPAIRNGVLLILSQKTSTELLDRAGKEKLAKEIMRESVRPLGIELDEEEEDAHADDKAAEEKPKKKKKRKAAAHNPVEQVHFSSFIIQ